MSSVFELFGEDRRLATVTTEAVTSVLAGFALPLVPGRDMEWLAMAVRRSLAISMPSSDDDPNRTSNKDIREELERLSALAGSTWQQLFLCDPAADSRLWWFASGRWDGDGGTVLEDGNVLGNPSEYRRFKTAIAELDWLASFLREAAKATPSDQGPWRQSAQKRLRIERGQYLATIFEAAFGLLVSANNYPNDATRPAPTPFMDFYGRVVTLAFGARETANLAEVVKAACQLHRQHPVQFAEGIIPGL